MRSIFRRLSLSVWREWIEINSKGWKKEQFLSLSVWREWIEMIAATKSPISAIRSLSVWREWIEIKAHIKKAKNGSVSLCMERVD